MMSDKSIIIHVYSQVKHSSNISLMNIIWNVFGEPMDSLIIRRRVSIAIGYSSREMLLPNSDIHQVEGDKAKTIW